MLPSGTISQGFSSYICTFARLIKARSPSVYRDSANREQSRFPGKVLVSLLVSSDFADKNVTRNQ